MNRRLAMLLCAAVVFTTVCGGVAPARDTLLRIQLDERPLDRTGYSAILHRGRAFVNVVRAVKAFDGLLTFGRGDRSVRVTIRGKTADFFVGRRDGRINGQPARFPAAPFILNGDTYVPLTVITRLAGARSSVDVHRHVARLTSALPES